MDKIITISREYGAGGHSIGQQVAKELGIPFYDRDILKATVQTSGFDPDMVEHDQEDVSSTNFFFKSICSFADASFSDTQDAIHDVQKAVILHFASRHTYYNHYTGKKWGDSHNYHLVLDSGKLGYSLCTKLIIEAAKGE